MNFRVDYKNGHIYKGNEFIGYWQPGHNTPYYSIVHVPECIFLERHDDYKTRLTMAREACIQALREHDLEFFLWYESHSNS